MDSRFGHVRPHQHGKGVGQQFGLIALCTLPFIVMAGTKHPFKHQLHTTHVEAGDWELHGMRWEGGSALIADRCASKFM